MSAIQRLISPKLPTALENQGHVDLPGLDIWLHNINNVHVLPMELDVPSFEEALSKALQLYPHVAGQLRSSDGRWSIELTNTAIPVDIDYRQDGSFDSFLNGDWIIQDDISSFLNPQPVGANLVNGGAPLLRLKLTFFKSETCIGVSWHHTLGEAIVLSRFMDAISQLYQGLPLQYVPPTFKKYHYPAPSSSVTTEFWPRMPHLHDTCSSSEIGARYGEILKNTEPLRWRFETQDLSELRSALSSKGEADDTYLSKQDCLTAYVVNALNESRNLPVRKVTNASSFRHIKASFIDEDVVNNPLQNVLAIVPTDMAGIATALRRALVQSREPDFIHKWASVAGNHMLETANAGRTYVFSPHDDVVVVNSNAVIDWQGAHFGCPDGSRFYSSGVFKFNLRCFKTNPTKGEDGAWKPRQAIDISMGVPPEVKPKMVETLTRGIQYNLNKGTQ